MLDNVKFFYTIIQLNVATEANTPQVMQICMTPIPIALQVIQIKKFN